RVPCKGDLPTIGRDLNDASAPLSAKVRQRGADEVDRPDQVGRDDVFHLLVGELLRCAEQAVTGVADDHVDPSALRERALDNSADRGWEYLGISRDQIGDFAGVADGSYNAVAALKKLIGELATKTAADSSDKPCALWHSEFSYCWFIGQCTGVAALVVFTSGTTSSMTRSALRVRGYPMYGSSWVATLTRRPRSLPTLRFPATCPLT